MLSSTEEIKAWPTFRTHAHFCEASPESPALRTTRRYTLVTRSPFLCKVADTLRPKSAAPEKVCSMLSTAKLVCLLYTTLKKVICGLPVR
jgi:hypothetical protein